ncbi:MAG: hypothetical protein PHQ30_04240, partial [Candidatus Izemoplasmatales bacterium]|nr:hypothetical protein [Candidatus Izemoplasmatales bacterium]
LHVAVHNPILQEVNSKKIELLKSVAHTVGLVAHFDRNGGSRSSVSWLTSVGPVAQSASDYPLKFCKIIRDSDEHKLKFHILNASSSKSSESDGLFDYTERTLLLDGALCSRLDTQF